MPELPEVHTTATMLDTLVQGAHITHVWTDYTKSNQVGTQTIKNPAYFKKFQKAVVGTTIERVFRQGKYIIFSLNNNLSIIAHMRMTGHFLVGTYQQKSGIWKSNEAGPLQEPINQHIHFVLSLSDGRHMVLSDVRKFASITLTHSLTFLAHKSLSTLGPDPTQPSFSFTTFKERLTAKNKSGIKTALLDQKVFAGIGNIYSDEILWTAGVHPLSKIENIPLPVMRLLFVATKKLLSHGVTLGGDSTSDYRNPLGKAGDFHNHHHAYQKTKTNCQKRNCRGTIQRIPFSGRGAHFCDTHQKLY